jgi:hypothetical protein
MHRVLYTHVQLDYTPNECNAMYSRSRISKLGYVGMKFVPEHLACFDFTT